MSFARKDHDPGGRWHGRAVRRAPDAGAPWGLVVRAFLFGAVAIVGAAWGLLRHCTHELPPLRTPAPAATFDPDAGELPVPELLPLGED